MQASGTEARSRQVWTGPILREHSMGLPKPVMPAGLGRVMHMALKGRRGKQGESTWEECRE